MEEDSAGEWWCNLCIKLFVGVGLTLVLLWLLVPQRPNCSIQYLYVPALNKSLNSQPLNTTLNFMVRFDNPNIPQGIYYDDVHISLSNTVNSSSLLLADYTVPRFYQGYQKKAKKWGQVLPLNNQTVLRSVLPNGSAVHVFRLDLKTKVRFRVMFWRTERHRVEVGADVEVNGDGAKAAKKGIKMKKSSSSPLGSYFPVCVLMNLLVFFTIL